MSKVAKRKPSRAEKLEARLREVAALYESHGQTAVGVAEVLGITRQRAAVLLSLADEAGFVAYERRPLVISKAQARKALRTKGGIVAAAASLGVNDATFRNHFPELVVEAKERAANAFTTPANVREERAQYAATRRIRAREDGICTSCFAVPAGQGRATCVTCSGKAVARRDRLRGK